MGSVAPANPATSRLFKPLKLGNHTVQHRAVLAPLTRNRSDEDHVPAPFAAKYYADRGAVPGTLVITEATAISHAEEGQANTPGFVSDAQSARWKDIISAVHANGSIFFQQIWALGRATDPAYAAKQGLPYRSSSATPMKGSDATPTAMTEEEIQQTITDFVETAKRVRAAGGDGVEIHSAHGYLLDQFLSDAVNKRTDKWGGSPENRARLTIEVVKQVSAAIGAGNVALRLSPYAGFQGADKSDIVGQYTYLIQELKKADLKLAYVSLVEARGDPAHIVLGASQLHEGKTLDFILEAWDNQSPVIVAGGYTGENAQQAVDGHYAKWDVLVAFGRHFLANPDLPFRIRHGIELNAYDRSTFYKVLSEDGYTDYPFSKEFLEAENKSVSNE